MANSPVLPVEVLQNISAQIADRIPQSSKLAAPGAAAGLGESLPVAMLTQDNIIKGAGTLADRVVKTGQWHHQIYADGSAMSFARSVEEPGAPGIPADVVEVASSSVAEDLRQTIAWIDANVHQDGAAEVIIVPSHFLTGIWLYGPSIDAVVVSSVPAEMDQIRVNTLIPGDEFLSTLASIPAIEGLGLPDEPAPPVSAGV
jgi:hypothetical protein